MEKNHGHVVQIGVILKIHLEHTLMAQVIDMTIVMTDMVQDKTIVDVTYRVDGRQRNSGLGDAHKSARSARRTRAGTLRTRLRRGHFNPKTPR